MLLAEQLLATTNLPVSEVARVSGYADHAYFSQQFRQRTCASPSSFRKIHSLSSS